jgi:hypothetical protein
MKIYSNNKLIKRNHTLGNVFSIGALVILGVGMYLSYKMSTDVVKLIISYACLIVGFLIFQLGTFFTNRWGRSPRPDEIISQSLKGLDDRYTLYHYMTPVSHLLVGPAGVIALLPYSQKGTLQYESKKKDWKQYGGNWFLKLFGQENLGRPASEAKYIKEDLERYLTKIGADVEAVKPGALLVFTNDKAKIIGEGSPVAYVTAAKLKDYLRKKGKETPFDAEKIVDLIGITEE